MAEAVVSFASATPERLPVVSLAQVVGLELQQWIEGIITPELLRTFDPLVDLLLR
ncbi:hypothetical protein Poly59_57320 [Rubripirellula reticaptiva]|uniref:Uncharacterized protein n=1 Tax=Rubripirellula reticaptiva TaxID=2528013 RepID=A0A5C6EHR7_9BACT|nr:hypothetical protein Poly59_57320 [Rubripirellula reticaptiva]